MPGKKPTVVCILAGGLSQRMGRDKSRLRLGRRTLVGHLRATVKELGWPVRVLRRDLVERCGPLGGIYTALRTTRAEVVMFLACDMPFVSSAWLQQLRSALRMKDHAVFTVANDRVGFPLILRRGVLETVKEQMSAGKLSLQDLALGTRGRKLCQPAARAGEALNINLPADWLMAVERLEWLRRESMDNEKRAKRDGWLV